MHFFSFYPVLRVFFLLLFMFAIPQLEAASLYESTKDLPVAYQGRFRSLESAAHLWQENVSNTSDRSQNPIQFSDHSALTRLWTSHFLEPHEEISLQALLMERLQSAGQTMRMLPLKFASGEWVSLHAFHLSYENFTAFSTSDFIMLRDAYLELEEFALKGEASPQLIAAAQQFATIYRTAYSPLVEKPYRQAQGKSLFYPSFLRLQAETFYYRLPLIEIVIGCYGLAFILLIASRWLPEKKMIAHFALTALWTAFVIHTAILALRCYILARPPVSNMFETIIYVPWITMTIGLIFYVWMRSRGILAAATAASGILLTLLKLTYRTAELENVQAVLDSQYWLIIHVLMVVASYGAFALSGVLGHCYLVTYAWSQKSERVLKGLGRGILYSMYIGVGLLIPGTILGGVWAAQSWGRFWDWDPKESWAFISACIYLLFIHAYTFGRIRDFGLAIGSVAGLMAISFTWYGVNYVLGTGLHSYGFGQGGEFFYFLYVGIEAIFLVTVSTWGQRKRLLKL